jgi:hypothetical protein
MKTVTLPKLPKGKEFEEFVSAFLQCKGCYIERNPAEEGIVELDIIATDYNSFLPDRSLIEVKSGEWRFKDIFALRGWMDYLGISRGLFITQEAKEKVADLQNERARTLNIDFVAIPDLDKAKQKLSRFVDTSTADELDISLWQYSYWIERNMIRRLKDSKKSCKLKKRFGALDEYYTEVNSGIFFAHNIVEKLYRVYSAFYKWRHISAMCGNELVGNDFDEVCDTIPKSIYEDTFFKCAYNDIQISMFIEHRARLAIMKSAIDYKLYKDAGISDKTEDAPIEYETLGIQVKTSMLDSLPSRFMKDLDSLSKDKYFNRYPVFWQWFMWFFGGFLLKDFEQKEYEMLSQKTGIPVSEIPNALKSYEKLFPYEKGWFQDFSPKSNIVYLKMFPVPFMGIGAHYRKLLYQDSTKTEPPEYSDLNLSGPHTMDDLIKWNNSVVESL